MNAVEPQAEQWVPNDVCFQGAFIQSRSQRGRRAKETRVPVERR